MSTEQQETLDAILRQATFADGDDVEEQRRALRELLSAQPLPADVTVTAAVLGGVPTAEITVDGIEPRHVVLYFHGGVYVMGDAALAADLASQIGRRTQAKVISVDYRLAPEHPYPAAVDDALAAYEALLESGVAPADIAFAGESAGGGLAVATLVNARDHGLPPPAAAFVMSPYADLTLTGTTMETKRTVDPLMSRERMQPRVTDYVSGQDAALGLISPIFADLSGLPPLIVQAGSHEVLLDDAIRLARQAATADVEVTLDITPGVPHVFQAYYAILDEGAAALDRAGQLLSAHLAEKLQAQAPAQVAGTELTPTEAADRVAIRELFDAYAHCADRRDAEGQKALFTEDTHFVVYMEGEGSEPTQELNGREALTPVFADLNRYEATTHFNGQSTVALDGNRATGESYCLAHHLYTEGGDRKLMVASLRYLDSFSKSDGSWLFAERKLYVDWAETRSSDT